MRAKIRSARTLSSSDPQDILLHGSLDPNMLQLKNILEKDASIAAPKYVQHFHAPDKPLDLVHSILKVRSRILHAIPLAEKFRKDSVVLSEVGDSPSRRSATPQPVQRGSIRAKPAPSQSIGDSASEFSDGLKKGATPPLFSKFSYETVRLNPCLSKQADVVLRHLSKKTKFSMDGKVLVQRWARDMKLKIDEHGKLNEKDQPAPVVKPFYLQKLEKEINTVYGEGLSRRLKPGEEATILETIESLKLGIIEAEMIPQISFALYRAKVLELAGLAKLIDYPFCLKQVEIHIKLMFTKLRCSMDYRKNEKKLKKFMSWAEAKNWLIDLNSGNELSSYLLENCIVDDAAAEIDKIVSSSSHPSFVLKPRRSLSNISQIS